MKTNLTNSQPNIGTSVGTAGKTLEKLSKVFWPLKRLRSGLCSLTFCKSRRDAKLLENVQSLAFELDIEHADITSCFRVGKIPLRSDDTEAPQVVKVRLSTVQLKWAFINGVNRSERLTKVDELQKICAQLPDLTFDQCQNNRELSVELKRRFADGVMNMFTDHK